MRILFIDDQEHTRKHLAELIREIFPRATIDTAGTVSDGLKMLDNASQTDHLYDVAIIDFELPYEFGAVPQISVEIPEKIRRSYKSTLIIYITAYADDPRVLNHLGEHHAEPGHSATAISKLSTDELWTNRLIAQLQSHVYQKKISGRMSRIFDGYSVYDGVSNRTERGKMISVTYELAALLQEIADYWKYLDERYRRALRERFEIDESTSPVQVRLR